MPAKYDLYQSYGEKLIGLFVRLLFSGERHSLTELSQALNCSKQTVLRLITNIRKSYGVEIEETKQGNKSYYRIRRPSVSLRNVPITEDEIRALQICKAFTQHLVGKKLYEEATRAIFKSKAEFVGALFSESHFGASYAGTIDYTSHYPVIQTLIEAMEKQKVCKLTYQASETIRSKTFHIKPRKLFSHRDAIYLYAQKAKEPGRPYHRPEFDPLLAVHRIKSVVMTNINFQSEKFDFAKSFNRHFGIIKDEVFEVEAVFSGWAAGYVSERRWSPNQEIVRKGPNRIRLRFTASSEPEVISWLLFFGENTKLIKPEWLVEDLKSKINQMGNLY